MNNYSVAVMSAFELVVAAFSCHALLAIDSFFRELKLNPVNYEESLRLERGQS